MEAVDDEAEVACAGARLRAEELLGEGDEGGKGVVLEDVVALLARDVGERPRGELRDVAGRDGADEEDEFGDGAGGGDGERLLGRPGGDVDEHPEGLADEARAVVVREELRKERDEAGVDDGLHWRVIGAGEEAAAGDGGLQAALRAALQRAEHDAVVEVHARRALVEVGEVREPAAEEAGGPGACERGGHVRFREGARFFGRDFKAFLFANFYFWGFGAPGVPVCIYTQDAGTAWPRTTCTSGCTTATASL